MVWRRWRRARSCRRAIAHLQAITPVVSQWLLPLLPPQRYVGATRRNWLFSLLSTALILSSLLSLALLSLLSLAAALILLPLPLPLPLCCWSPHPLLCPRTLLLYPAPTWRRRARVSQQRSLNARPLPLARHSSAPTTAPTTATAPATPPAMPATMELHPPPSGVLAMLPP